MSWLKNILVDLIVTAFIIVAVAGGWTWARWIVLGYTGLMLLLKLGALLTGRAIKQLQDEAGTPPWIFHLLYLVDVAVLVVGGWWIAAAAWLAIWLLSYIQERR